jgi:hypothetical protein
MTTRDIITTWLAAAALALLLAFVGPTLDHAAEAVHTELAAQDARADARAQRRRDLAAAYICGPHSEPRWISDRELACANNGDKVRVVKLAGAASTTPGARP